MAPAQVLRWLRQTYPKPTVNSEWLDACCDWVVDEMNLNPTTQTDAFIAEVENQLLESDLRDAMEPGTGFPQNASNMNNQRIRGAPHILVEIVSMTEIGHGAFNLHNIRQARIEREDLAGLAQQEGVEDEEGPIPNYPRSMLKLELSDGSVTMTAIEYRPIPQLKLDETPLGFKILIKDVLVRRGIIFLEPKGIVLKGHKNADRDNHRDRDFFHSLLRRMMKPIPVEDLPEVDDSDENQPPPNPYPAQRNTEPATARVQNNRPALREISEPPELSENGTHVDNEVDLPRKRRVPYLPPPPSSSNASSSNTLVASHFFAGTSSASTVVDPKTERLARVLFPVRGDPIDITDSSMEDPAPAGPPGPSSSITSRSSKPPRDKLKPPTDSFNTPFINGSSSTVALHPKKISYEDFEFDDADDELDSAFLDEVAKLEREALSKTSGVSRAVVAAHSSSQPHSRAQPRKVDKEPEDKTAITGASRGIQVTGLTSSALKKEILPTSTSARRPEQPSRLEAQVRPKGHVDPAQDVIIIEEDDDDDDKENVPVPQRRVRRRVSMPPMDVIDISD